MPLPLAIAPIYAAVTSAKVTSAIGAAGLLGTGGGIALKLKPYIDEYLKSEDYKETLLNAVSGYIVDMVFEKTGLALDPADPLTKASFTTAIGQKLGVTLTDLSDAQAIQDDLSTFVKDTINARAGTEFSSFNLGSPDELKDQLSLEFTNQFGKALAGAPSLLSAGDTSTIRAMALAGTSESGAPVTIPYTTKRLLAARSASKKSYNKKRMDGMKRVWIQLPTEPVEEP
jgi:hypothetical protein